MYDGEFIDEQLGKAYDARLVRRLVRYVLPHRRFLVLACLFLFASTGLELLMPFVFKSGIDRFLTRPQALAGAHQPGATNAVPQFVFATNLYQHGVGVLAGDRWEVPQTALGTLPPRTLLHLRANDARGIGLLALVVLLIIVLRVLAEYGHALTLQIVGQRAMHDLRMVLFRHLQGLALRFYDGNPVGRLVTRVTNDIDAISEVFTTVLVHLVRDLLYFIGAATILFVLNARLALLSMVLLPFFVLVAVIFRAQARNVYRRIRRLLSQLNATLAEDISGVKIIQAFLQERRRQHEFDEKNTAYFRANMRELVVFGVFRPLVDTLRSLGTALVLVFAGLSIINGDFTIGALVAFLQYLNEMYRPIIEISQQYTVMQSAMAAAERIFKILDETPEIAEAAVPRAPAAPVGTVEFDDVSFAYVDGTPVLRNVSFAVAPGRSVAIVGPTGAGKTSIINLVCRFYDPQQGHIRLDGVDVRDWPLAALRRHIAIVLQDAFIFSRAVADNIQMGRADIARATVAAAAATVQAREFIEHLPGGFEEMMMERGATLSAGQKQLLCFARALAHDPKVLILDEATSNVDPATEALIQAAIERLMRGRTSIIVAHRLSTIKKADEILVLDGGRIVERGTHASLFAQRGVYYNLCLLQFGGNDTPSNAER
jgi:ABC-type multidrug transport system fused ATPase/permease subunit